MAQRSKPRVHNPNEEWLALGAEPSIGLDIEVIDSHIHLWDFSDPPYFMDSYMRDAEGTGITTSVFVDCTMGYQEEGPEDFAPVGEVRFAATQAERYRDKPSAPGAIIGWADLTLGDAIEPVLQALEEAGGGRYRGVRTRATYDPDPFAGYGEAGAPAKLLLDEDYRRGVARLSDRGNLLELYAFHTQLHEVADLASTFPTLPIILNHIGGPIGVGPYATAREKVFADWTSGITEVAACPNVLVKVSGFAISRLGIVRPDESMAPLSSSELADICRPWVSHCFAEFGADRCLFGSNFPVDKVAFPLQTLVNAMKLLTEPLPPEGQEKFFAGNARRIYRLS